MLTLTFIALLTIYIFRNKFTKRTLFLISSILLLVIIWTRFGLGADYFSYANMYNILNIDGISSIYSNFVDIEIGYKLLMYPFRLLNLPFYIFLGIINTFVTILIFKWIDENSNTPSLSIILFYSMFFFVWVLSALRQSIVLAIALYFLFNKKKKLDIKKEIILILFLSLIHKSALALLIFIILKRFNWNRKRHLIVIVIAVLITLIPIKSIIVNLDFIPFINSLLSYTNDSRVIFYDFAGLIRILIFGFVIYFYNDIKDTSDHVDTFLSGTSLYFILKFSETTASRSTIYSFILLIIILPNIILVLNEKINNSFKVIIPLLSVSFCFVYFTKEFKTMFNQSKYFNEVTYLTYPNILTSSVTDFNSKESFDFNIRKTSQILSDSRPEDLINAEMNYVEGEKYLNTSINNESVFIDQKGRILNVEGVSSNDYIHDGILVTSGYKDEHFFSHTILIDLSDENRSIEEMENIIILNNKNKFSGNDELRVGDDISVIPKEIMKFFPNESSINKVVKNKIENDNVTYYIIRVDYLGIKNYLYLSEEGDLLFPMPSSYAYKYDSEGFLSLRILNNRVVINSNGEIISWEK